MPNSSDKETSASQDRLLRKKQVADILACSQRTVDRLVSMGHLTRVKILGGIRFRFSEVQIIMNGGQL